MSDLGESPSEFFYTFSSTFKELCFLSYQIRQEMQRNRMTPNYDPPMTDDQRKLEHLIRSCSHHMLSRCFCCGIGYTISDCNRQHLFLQSGGRWRPDSYVCQKGTHLAYCGMFLPSKRLQLLLRFINISRISLEGTHLGRPPTIDPDCTACIYCVERVLLHDDGYQLICQKEEVMYKHPEISLQDWVCGNNDDMDLFEIPISGTD
uniref:Protein 4 n=1 Tax=Pinus yunnanensis virus 1 TaxID=2977981 RepID=A0A9N6YJD3_9RHAB|nr:TPA_asm: protein 4 [Pinus yunnanensis virus 1]